MIPGSLVVAMIGLMLVITVHIVVIARWSGKVDSYLAASEASIRRMDGEIERLRVSRHLHEGQLQRHEGLLREYERRRAVQP